MSDNNKITPTEVAGEEMAAMWNRLGEILKERAFEEASSGDAPLAMRFARFASVAIWQSTGEGDFESLKDTGNI